MKRLNFVIPFFSILFAINVNGAELPPSGGEELKIEPNLLEFKSNNKSLKTEVIEVDSTKVLSIKTLELIKSLWGLNMCFTVPAKVDKGDVMLFEAKLRCSESLNSSKTGHVEIFYKVKSAQGTKPSLFTPLDLTSEWKTYYIPFTANISSDEKGQLFFLLGGIKPQTLQVESLKIINFKKRFTIDKLPLTKLTYAGAEDGAKWRKEAFARIEKIRKGTLKVTVRDKNNKLLKNVIVNAKLKRHAFDFGCNINAMRLYNPKWTKPEDREKFLSNLLKSYNKFVLNNCLKWRYFNPKYAFPALDWAKKNKVPIRGHNMVWGRFKSAAYDVEAKRDYYEKHPEEFRKIVRDRIRKCAELYPDTISEWDVINEPSVEKEFIDILGKKEMVEWINIAKASNPKQLTCTNDYAILSGHDLGHREAYYDVLKYLIDNGAKLDTIGFQGHFQGPVPPVEVYERLQQFAKFGCNMMMTEYSIECSDEQLRAQFTRDLMILLYSFPQFTGIVTWEVESFFNKDGSKKQIALEWDKLVNKMWNTDVTEKTDGNGQVTIRGYNGEYELTVTVDGKTYIRDATISRKGESLDLTL